PRGFSARVLHRGGWNTWNGVLEKEFLLPERRAQPDLALPDEMSLLRYEPASPPPFHGRSATCRKMQKPEALIQASLARYARKLRYPSPAREKDTEAWRLVA